MNLFGWLRRIPTVEPEAPRLKPYEKLQKFWQVTGSDIVTCKPDETEIQKLELRYGVRLPEDFREYLLRACPADVDVLDGNNSTWWPIERIKNIPEELEHAISHEVIARDASKYVFFVDHMIWCWAWAICCDEGENRGRVAIIAGGDHDRFVAENFAEFVDLYVRHDQRIF